MRRNSSKPIRCVRVPLFCSAFLASQVLRSAPVHDVVREHPVEFRHVADEEGHHQKKQLLELARQKEAESSKSIALFTMDVDSVFCGEGICRKDTVSLYWTELGQYHSYALEEGTELEKGNGHDFEEADYVKLDTVLANTDSELANRYAWELIKGRIGANTVEAVSGATVIMPKDHYVGEAVWTSFTLWHYAHGEIVETIRDLSGSHYSESDFVSFLEGKDLDYQAFALEQLRRKGLSSKSVLEGVYALVEKADESLNRELVEFAESQEDVLFGEVLLRYIALGSADLRFLCLDSLAESDRLVDSSFLKRLCTDLSLFDDYQQLTLVLTHLEEHGSLELLGEEQVEALLDNDNFVVAREAYWILLRNEVSEGVKALLNRFYENHHERL